MTDTAPDPEPSALDLAQALDVVVDNAINALDSGDLPTATALLDSASATSDSLLDALGSPEVDTAPAEDSPPAPDPDGMPPGMVAP